MIYQVKGTELESFYKGLDERISIISPVYGGGFKNTIIVQAHLVQPEKGEHLSLSFDGVTWYPMQKTGMAFYRGLFSASFDTTILPDGIIQLQVKSNKGNEIWIQPQAVDSDSLGS